MYISIIICIFANQNINTIDMRSFVPNKKEHKSDYFKVINSEVKAYILMEMGLLGDIILV